MSTGIALLHLGLAAVMSLIALNGYLRRAAKAKTDAALSVAWVGLLLAAAYFFGWKQGLLATVLSFLYTTIATPFAKRLARRMLGYHTTTAVNL
jgi:hypothetical protein